MSWLDRLRKPALRAVPATRRQKNYMAESGYAYEYFHEGMRETAAAREHVFTVSGDRKNWFQVTVLVPHKAMGAWEQAHGRVLEDNERYAIAKMALFEAFDERPAPADLGSVVRVTAGQVEALLGRLGIG